MWEQYHQTWLEYSYKYIRKWSIGFLFINSRKIAYRTSKANWAFISRFHVTLWAWTVRAVVGAAAALTVTPAPARCPSHPRAKDPPRRQGIGADARRKPRTTQKRRTGMRVTRRSGSPSMSSRRPSPISCLPTTMVTKFSDQLSFFRGVFINIPSESRAKYENYFTSACLAHAQNILNKDRIYP